MAGTTFSKIAAAILLASSACSSAGAQVTVEQLIGRIVEDASAARYAPLAEALARHGNGETERALAILKELAASNPELPPAETLLATMHVSAGRLAEARGALEDATQAVPADPEAYLLLGDIALSEGRLTEAELLYFRGGELVADYDKNKSRRALMQAGMYSGLTAALSARGKWKEAEQAARAWSRLDPHSPAAATRLGRAQFHLRQYGEAYKTFQGLFDGDPTAPRPEINMGLLYEELVAAGEADKRESAKRAMLLAVEKAPDDSSVRLTVARWALSACELEIAGENVQAALEMDGGSHDALLVSGTLARHRGDSQAAEAAFSRALAQSPASFPARMQIALELAGKDDPASHRQALEHARLLSAAYDDLSQLEGREAAVTLGWVLGRMGQAGQALRTVQAAIAAGNIGDEAAYYAADVFAGSDRPADAARLLAPVIQRSHCTPTLEEARKLWNLVGE